MAARITISRDQRRQAQVHQEGSMTLKDCVPQDKYDVGAISRAGAMGYPAINPILGELLRWTRDINWPVGPHAATLLRSAGPEIAPHIIGALRSDDGDWTLNILWEVAGYLRPDAWRAIAAEVERVAQDTAGVEMDEDLFEAATRAIRMQAGAGAAS